MNIRGFFRDLLINQRALLTAGFCFAVLFIVLAVVSIFDSQQILGINRWIKPMKFASSIAIFLWTLAIYLHFLRGYEKSSRLIAWGAIAMMMGEIVLIVMQSARGTTSHFNTETAFDAAIFTTMGAMIMLNTLLMIYLTYLYFRVEINLPRAVLWGMRLGLVIFLLASFEGAYMSAQLRHSIGVADGGAGLPFVNWSTEGGDLRVAHFFGLHAFQAIPLFASLLVFLQKRFAIIRATTLTIIFSIVYLTAFTTILAQSLRGRPLLGKQMLGSQRTIRNEKSCRV